jgi:hypothetical protein
MQMMMMQNMFDGAATDGNMFENMFDIQIDEDVAGAVNPDDGDEDEDTEEN